MNISWHSKRTIPVFCVEMLGHKFEGEGVTREAALTDCLNGMDNLIIEIEELKNVTSGGYIKSEIMELPQCEERRY